MIKGTRSERVLVIDMTMTDPLSYTRTVTAQKKWVEVPNGHLLPYECAKAAWRVDLEQVEKESAVLIEKLVAERYGFYDAAFAGALS